MTGTATLRVFISYFAISLCIHLLSGVITCILSYLEAMPGLIRKGGWGAGKELLRLSREHEACRGLRREMIAIGEILILGIVAILLSYIFFDGMIRGIYILIIFATELFARLTFRLGWKFMHKLLDITVGSIFCVVTKLLGFIYKSIYELIKFFVFEKNAKRKNSGC